MTSQLRVINVEGTRSAILMVGYSDQSVSSSSAPFPLYIYIYIYILLLPFICIFRNHFPASESHRHLQEFVSPSPQCICSPRCFCPLSASYTCKCSSSYMHIFLFFVFLSTICLLHMQTCRVLGVYPSRVGVINVW